MSQMVPSASGKRPPQSSTRNPAAQQETQVAMRPNQTQMDSAQVVVVVHLWALQMGTTKTTQVPTTVYQTQDWQAQIQIPHHLREN